MIESACDEGINELLLHHQPIADMTSNLSYPPQMIETSADDLGDVLLHCELVVNENSKASNDVYWLDDVTADRECDASAGQLLKTLPRTNPHELHLQHIKLQPTRSTPVDHIGDAVTKASRRGLDFSNWCRDV